MNRPSTETTHHDDLLFLTDTGYDALLGHESPHKWASKSKDRQDGLFFERLDSFIEGQQKDIESFAKREQRSLTEIRKLVAIPHARYVLSLDPTLPPTSAPQSGNPSQPSGLTFPSIRETLSRISSILQLLHNAVGMDSLLLVVSPRSTSPFTTSTAPSHSNTEKDNSSPVSSGVSEASWIGGTELGKEFWMGLKGGGMNGAKAFRVKCQMQHEAESHHSDLDISTSMRSTDLLQTLPPPTSDEPGPRTIKLRSTDVKRELNSAIRQALRSASDNPSAEMRWTKPACLEESYNVRLVGWPPTVAMRNPSNNSLKDNRLLLDLVRGGRIRFVKRDSPEWGNTGPASEPERTSPASLDQELPQSSPILNPAENLAHIVSDGGTSSLPNDSHQVSQNCPNAPSTTSGSGSHSSLSVTTRLTAPTIAGNVSVIDPAVTSQKTYESTYVTDNPSNNGASKRRNDEQNSGRMAKDGREAKRSKTASLIK